MDITIHKVDETYIRIECDDSIAGDLVDFFSYSDTTWVAKKGSRKRFPKAILVKLFKIRTKTLYRGLLPYVQQFAEDNNLTIGYSDPSLEYAADISYFEIEKYAKTLNLHSKGKPIESRDYQIKGVVHALRNRRTLLLSPTASGKSLVCYLIVRILSTILRPKKQRILIIVPTIHLTEQLYKDFIDYSSVNGWNTEANVHRIHAEYEKFDVTKQIYISTWQSLATMPLDYFKDFGAIIGDEAHLTAAATLKNIISYCVNAKYRVGMTGTLDESPIHKLVIEGLFGVSYRVAKTKELMDRNELATLNINSILLKHSFETEIKMSSEEEMDFILLNNKRNKFICNLAMSLKNNTLILFRFVERHGEVLYRMLNQMNDGSKKIYIIHGKVDVETREIIRGIMETEDNAIIVASYGTYSTGVSINNLHNLIFGAPSAGIVRILQSIGRTLRLNANKSVANLFDIGDDTRFSNKSDNNYTLDHYIKRLAIYKSEEFTTKLYKVKI